MPKMLVTLDETEDHILEMVKAKYKIKTKAETVPFILQYFYEELLGLEYRPEFIEKLKKMSEEPDDSIPFDSVDELFDSIREENRREDAEKAQKAREKKQNALSRRSAQDKRRSSHRSKSLQKSQVRS